MSYTRDMFDGDEAEFSKESMQVVVGNLSGFEDAIHEIK